MPRKLIARWTMKSTTGEQYNVLHFVRLSEETDSRGSPVVRRRDSFETTEGFPVVLATGGGFSVFVNGAWSELIECVKTT